MSPHQVRLEVRLPEGHWSGDVTRANPSAILRIEKHMPLSRGKELLEFHAVKISLNQSLDIQVLKIIK